MITTRAIKTGSVLISYSGWLYSFGLTSGLRAPFLYIFLAYFDMAASMITFKAEVERIKHLVNDLERNQNQVEEEVKSANKDK